MQRTILPLIVTLAAATSGLAAQLGDPAASLQIAQWIKGNPVELEAVKGRQYVVVEFWATWCPPCLTSIPHLTELQKKYDDVVVVGITDEDAATVRRFVAKMGDKMDYVVAIDDRMQTRANYMDRFKAEGLPYALVVDKESRVVWRGRPMDGLDEALERLHGGNYDLAAAEIEIRRKQELETNRLAIQQKLELLTQMIMLGEDNEQTRKLEAELTAYGDEVSVFLSGKKFVPEDFRNNVLFSQKVQKYQQAAMNLASSNELAALEKDLTIGAPEGFDIAEFKRSLAARIEMRKAYTVLQEYIDGVTVDVTPTRASELGRKVENLQLQSPEMLNQLAWVILSEPSIKYRDLNLATKLAGQAVENSQGGNPVIIDTYARALFDSGKIAEAIEQQKKAVEIAPDEETRQVLENTLKKYQNEAKKPASPHA